VGLADRPVHRCLAQGLPRRSRDSRHFLDGFEPHLAEAGIGSISEVFDAEPPFTPRGCIAQAWSVAEVLRCLEKTAVEQE
jgi:glycogen debranching enzyme